MTPASSRWVLSAPALTLMVMAPLLAEVLPGATRLSAVFVFPIQMCVWGGGALLIRYAVRRWRLGWRNMLFLALVLSISEECLIQQTSLAPMVLQVQGEVYARSYGVNYVYFLWALAYETVFVVFLPVYLVEMLFPGRREGVWLSKGGLIAVVLFFLLGSGLAWFSWTRFARPNVFQVPVYNPPLEAILIAVAAICALVFAALGPFRHKLAHPSKPLRPPLPWMLGILGTLWAVLWYGLVLLGFGVAPAFPPPVAVSAGLVLMAVMLFWLPRWSSGPRWQRDHTFAIIFGTMMGSMMAGFIGFIGAAPLDLYFKIVVDIFAVVLMVVLGVKIKRPPAPSPSLEST